MEENAEGNGILKTRNMKLNNEENKLIETVKGNANILNREVPESLGV